MPLFNYNVNVSSATIEKNAEQGDFFALLEIADCNLFPVVDMDEKQTNDTLLATRALNCVNRALQSAEGIEKKEVRKAYIFLSVAHGQLHNVHEATKALITALNLRDKDFTALSGIELLDADYASDKEYKINLLKAIHVFLLCEFSERDNADFNARLQYYAAYLTELSEIFKAMEEKEDKGNRTKELLFKNILSLTEFFHKKVFTDSTIANQKKWLPIENTVKNISGNRRIQYLLFLSRLGHR